MILPPLRSLLVVATLGALVACGGGGGSTTATGSTGGTPAAQAVLVTGTITGFGSVHVNGVHFETSGASILRDKQSITQQSLRVGQFVTIKGSVSADGVNGSATTVEQDDNLEGPITQLDATAQTFVVLSHTVKVTADTSFDASLSPATFAGLSVGLQVEVSGTPDSTGAIVATRIEKRAAGVTTLEVLGKVSALDTTAKKFNIDTLVVNYATATLEDFPSSGIKADDMVEVKGSSTNGAGELVATKVELRNAEASAGASRREIEGLVTRFASPADFDVAGRKVTTTGSTTFQNGVAGDLKLDARVEAEGSIDASGVLVAVKIEFKRGGSAGLAGKVEAVTPATSGSGGTIKVLGVTITLDAKTRIEDKSPAKVDLFRINDINAGDYVRIRGTETAALALTATRLERDTAPSSGESFVRGTVRDVVRPSFTVLGVKVDSDTSTQFRFSAPSGTSAADAFFASGAGSVVSARGIATNGTIAATRVEQADRED